MIGEDLLKYNIKNKKFLVFDFETCNVNLQSPTNKIWGAGWLIADGYKTVESQDRYLDWPDMIVSRGAAAITGFTPQLIKDKGEDPEKVINDFESKFYDPQFLLLGQNIINFDIYLHNIARKLLNRPTDYSYINRILDFRALFLAFKIGYKFKKDESLLAQQYKLLSFYQKGLKSNLTQACKDLNIPVDTTKTHQASYDNELCFKAFIELIKILEI
jgi:DNA polymerase III alpha subunit (gram-positive type)